MRTSTPQIRLDPLERAEALWLAGDLSGTAGRHVFVSGIAAPVQDVHELDHYRRTMPAFANGPAGRIPRLRPQLVSGYRRAPEPEPGAVR